MIEVTGDARVLRATPAVVGVTYYEDGVVADPGVVTVSGVRADGSAFEPAGAVAGEEAAPRTLALTIAETSLVDVLTLTWESATLGTVTTTVEIVGRHLFSIAQARTFDGGALSNATNYPTAMIEEARARIEDAFEEICGVSFVPQLSVDVVFPMNDATLLLPAMRVSDVRFVQMWQDGDWVAVPGMDLSDLNVRPWGEVSCWTGRWPRTSSGIRVGYVHGYPQPPYEVSRAGVMLARYQLVESHQGDQAARAMGFSNEMGSYRLATAGVTRGSWFGLPLVDSVLQRYDETVPGVG